MRVSICGNTGEAARATYIVLMFAGKPILGIAGGIGGGKSLVASLFEELGCLVIRSDDQVTRVYQDPEVRRILRLWWGDEVMTTDGNVNRPFIAAKIFENPDELEKLERLVHPRVAELRDREMSAAGANPGVLAYVWDTPLLFETGLNKQCDRVVFVDSPLADRLQRLRETRGWDASELARREKSQWPLDKKRDFADDVISNTADTGFLRRQVKDVLSRVLTPPR